MSTLDRPGGQLVLMKKGGEWCGGGLHRSDTEITDRREHILKLDDQDGRRLLPFLFTGFCFLTLTVFILVYEFIISVWCFSFLSPAVRACFFYFFCFVFVFLCVLVMLRQIICLISDGEIRRDCTPSS